MFFLLCAHLAAVSTCAEAGRKAQDTLLTGLRAEVLILTPAWALLQRELEQAVASARAEVAADSARQADRSAELQEDDRRLLQQQAERIAELEQRCPPLQAGVLLFCSIPCGPFICQSPESHIVGTQKTKQSTSPCESKQCIPALSCSSPWLSREQRLMLALTRRASAAGWLGRHRAVQAPVGMLSRLQVRPEWTVVMTSVRMWQTSAAQELKQAAPLRRPRNRAVHHLVHPRPMRPTNLQISKLFFWVRAAAFQALKKLLFSSPQNKR